MRVFLWMVFVEARHVSAKREACVAWVEVLNGGSPLYTYFMKPICFALQSI